MRSDVDGGFGGQSSFKTSGNKSTIALSYLANCTNVSLYIRSALALGRPPYLTEAHANVTMLERSDFAMLGEEEPSDIVSQGADVFIAIVHLTHILAMIIGTFYSVRGLDNALSLPVADILSLFEKYARDLDHWVAAHFEPLTGSTGYIDATGQSAVQLLFTRCFKADLAIRWS